MHTPTHASKCSALPLSIYTFSFPPSFPSCPPTTTLISLQRQQGPIYIYPSVPPSLPPLPPYPLNPSTTTFTPPLKVAAPVYLTSKLLSSLTLNLTLFVGRTTIDSAKTLSLPSSLPPSLPPSLPYPLNPSTTTFTPPLNVAAPGYLTSRLLPSLTLNLTVFNKMVRTTIDSAKASRMPKQTRGPIPKGM